MATTISAGMGEDNVIDSDTVDVELVGSTTGAAERVRSLMDFSSPSRFTYWQWIQLAYNKVLAYYRQLAQTTEDARRFEQYLTACREAPAEVWNPFTLRFMEKYLVETYEAPWLVVPDLSLDRDEYMSPPLEPDVRGLVPYWPPRCPVYDAVEWAYRVGMELYVGLERKRPVLRVYPEDRETPLYRIMDFRTELHGQPAVFEFTVSGQLDGMKAEQVNNYADLCEVAPGTRPETYLVTQSSGESDTADAVSAVYSGSQFLASILKRRPSME